MREVASKKRRHAIHERWIAALSRELPEGVPADGYINGRYGDQWPATFGNYVDGKPVHQADNGQEWCFQCLHCRYYDPLESGLGMDWGACTNAASQYDGRVVFEHWTCRNYESDTPLSSKDTA